MTDPRRKCRACGTRLYPDGDGRLCRPAVCPFYDAAGGDFSAHNVVPEPELGTAPARPATVVRTKGPLG